MAESPERIEKEEPKFHVAKCPQCEETQPIEPEDYICIRCRLGEADARYNEYLEERSQIRDRLLAAEEFCWAFMLLISLGQVDIPVKDREFLGPSLEKWSDLAIATGVMKLGDEDEDESKSESTDE